jgi:hypothetical protein
VDSDSWLEVVGIQTEVASGMPGQRLRLHRLLADSRVTPW